MVVGALAADIGVLARGQIETFDCAESLEDLERSEDRRPTDAKMLATRCLEQAGRGEVPVLIGDQPGEGPAGSGQPIAGVPRAVTSGVGSPMICGAYHM